jgi:predicted phage baseplate assembly protein
VLSGTLVQGVRNITAAEGGAEGETTTDVIRRGPLTMRNTRQAITLEDYEALAREASPAIAVACALGRHPSGREAPGWVTVVVVPRSGDEQPQPSFVLRNEVRDFLVARSPAALSGRIVVIGPRYLPVGVDATVAPASAGGAGPVALAVEKRLRDFFHPVTGRDGSGWPFGRDVFVSDVAAALESVEGVDYAETLTLLVDGIPAGDRIALPPDQIVVAGPVRVRLAGDAR